MPGSDALHSALAALNAHVPYAFSYATAATREAAAGMAAGDVGKLALQESDNSLWLLTAITPTWRAVASGDTHKVTTVADTYIVLVSDELVICNKASAFTVTLPDEVVGQGFHIKNIGAGVVTIATNAGAGTIDGEATQALAQWDAIHIQSYAANGWVIL
jgi:hypothetical protein